MERLSKERKRKGPLVSERPAKTRSEPLNLKIYHGFIMKAMAPIDVS